MAALTDGRSVEPNADPADVDQTKNVGAEIHAGEDLHGNEDCDTSESSSEEEQIDDSIKQDMLKLEESFREHGMKFRLIDRIGEGTFSTVYKAEDLHYDFYQNDWDVDRNNENWDSPADRGKNGSQDATKSSRPRYVAIKKIYVTSSPIRIQNELELLHDLRGSESICPLITAFRHHDQVVAVLPHFQHQDFRTYYRLMNVREIKLYFRSLFEALAAVHKAGIIHRDIKPTNFLFDIHCSRGVLVDFGLAEREGTDCTPCLCQEHPSNRKARIAASRAFNQKAPTGYPKDDQRPSRRANRAGTRGFRAPEVLLKCTAQTTKIDIWSAGVILLTLLAERFPFFHSADDVDAMIELATMFGRNKMKSAALLHGATFDCTLNTVGDKGFPLWHVVQWSGYKQRPEDGNALEPDIMDAVKFLELLLEFDPRKRISARAALQTDFLALEENDTEAEEMDVL